MSTDALAWTGIVLVFVGLVMAAAWRTRPLVLTFAVVSMVGGLLVIGGAASQASDECEAKGGKLTRSGCVDRGVFIP